MTGLGFARWFRSGLAKPLALSGLFGLSGLFVLPVVLFLTACDRPAPMAHTTPAPAELVLSRRLAAAPATLAGPPSLARDRYRQVPVLGELDVETFEATMRAMTAWVSPQAGCTHCHVDGDMASEAKPAKQAARRMLRMVQHLNNDWKPHVGRTGVTCHTCHRGQPLPAQRWAVDPAGLEVDTPFRAYLQRPATSGAGLPPLTPAEQADALYGLMLHYAQALAADCTHCHDTPGATPVAVPAPHKLALQAKAAFGVRLLQDVNADLLASAPDARPAAQAHCGTCHQGARQPQGDGAPRAQDHAALWLLPTEPAAPPPPASLLAMQPAAAQGLPRAVRRTQGQGRVQFYATPNVATPLRGVFILPGESVVAVRQVPRFTAVHYVNPRTGGQAWGWVLSERLGG